MRRYHNKKDTKRIGEQVEKLRKRNGWNIEDIAAMTGFSRTTITSIEKGMETDTSHLMEIAKAIGVHPKELFDIPFEIKPRFKLPNKRKDRNNLTVRLYHLVTDAGFFNEPRFVAEVKVALQENFKIKADPIQISVTLIRMVKDGKLIARKVGPKNKYTAIRKVKQLTPPV